VLGARRCDKLHLFPTTMKIRGTGTPLGIPDSGNSENLFQASQEGNPMSYFNVLDKKSISYLKGP
jgi:hypothetical protein